VRTDDHAMEYATFEGRIGGQEYGGGTVIVWDTGPYVNRTERQGKPVDAAEAIEHGHIVVDLNGHKIAGRYALSRTKMPGRGENWLLVKADDEHADRRRRPATTQLESVLSGRTNDDL
jgi:DNA ligase D-like protein (predicted 3'-phosphoesterase)